MPYSEGMRPYMHNLTKGKCYSSKFCLILRGWVHAVLRLLAVFGVPNALGSGSCLSVSVFAFVMVQVLFNIIHNFFTFVNTF